MDSGVQKYQQNTDAGVKTLTDYGYRGYSFNRLETQDGGWGGGGGGGF